MIHESDCWIAGAKMQSTVSQPGAVTMNSVYGPELDST